MGYLKKQREPCILFLEAVFGTGIHPETLTKAGWAVECFADHFRDADGRVKDGILDPQIIRLCNANKWVLVTMDKQMRFTHVETIKQTEIGIIATTDCNRPPEVWIQALIRAKARIERCVKKHPRPWFARLGSTGALTVETIQPEASTRRHRPKEGQEH